MSLKVELKPGERLIVGNCVITNSDQRTRLFIDGKAPILREKSSTVKRNGRTLKVYPAGGNYRMVSWSTPRAASAACARSPPSSQPGPG